MTQGKKMTTSVRSILVAGTLLAASQLQAQGNISVEESVQLQAKPAAVWALVGDYNSLYRWHPAIAHSERSDKIRILTTGDGAQFVESLTALDEASYSYSYVIDKSPLPVSDYASTIQVQESKNGSQIIWRSSFSAKGVSDEKAAEIVRGIYKAGLGNLEKLYN